MLRGQNLKVMNVSELIKFLSNYPGDMPVVLIDTTTDDEEDTNYAIDESSFEVIECVSGEAGERGIDEPGKKGLFLLFENKFNPNPIN